MSFVLNPGSSGVIRVVLIGSDAACRRLAAMARGAFVVAGAYRDLAAARSANVEADAFLIAKDDRAPGSPPRPSASTPRHQRRDLDDGDAADDYGEPLTEREVEVLTLLAEGLSNKRIAARLGISDQTVKFHVASIGGKLGAHNRMEAVRRAVRRGLITL